MVLHLKDIASKNDAAGYYAGRILCDILPVVSKITELDGNEASLEIKEAKGPGSRTPLCLGNTHLISGFLLAALASGYSELLNGSKDLELILNGLVSSISGITASGGVQALIQDGLPKLASLNILCEVDDSFWNRVKEFRVVMLLRTTLNWVNALLESSVHWLVSAEVLRLVRSLLPWIKHSEGDFWEKIYSLLYDSLEVACFILSVNC